MRMAPDPSEPERTGGYGLYYHFDYVGGPRNYKWVDTQLLASVWEQLHLSYTLGVDRLWVVNVGDLKGNELPTEFFMDYAWNPERYADPGNDIAAWERAFAAEQFGEDNAEAVADILHRYSLLASDRKPELMNVSNGSKGCPFSLTDFREMERVTAEWKELAEDAEALVLPEAYADTYYQLVLYAVKASALMYELRLAGFNNLLYAKQGRAVADDMAEEAEALFVRSQAEAEYYNKEVSGGKWDGFQTQPYLGYSDWQQPEENNNALPDFIYPALETVEVPDGEAMGVGIDGMNVVWPESTLAAELPVFSPYQVQPAQYIEVFSMGTGTFDYEITTEPEAAWLKISNASGTIDDEVKQIRAELTIDDWSAVPEGTTTVTVTVTDLDSAVSVDVAAVIDNPSDTLEDGVFVESNGYVSMGAADARIVNDETFTWTKIADAGRTGSALTPFPVDADRIEPGGDSARLEYDMYLFTGGEVTVWVYTAPRQNVRPTDGLSFGLSFDDGDIEVVNITKKLDPLPWKANAKYGTKGWERGVADNVHRVSQKLNVDGAGTHTLKLWAVDPTLVVQNVFVETDDMGDSYLGPPRSMTAGEK